MIQFPDSHSGAETYLWGHLIARFQEIMSYSLFSGSGFHLFDAKLLPKPMWLTYRQVDIF